MEMLLHTLDLDKLIEKENGLGILENI